MRYLFLDLDGVANRHVLLPSGVCGIEADCMARLNHVIEATHCRLVIASAWRYMMLMGACNLFGFWYLLRTHGLKPLPDQDDTHKHTGPLVGCLSYDYLPVRNGDRGRLARDWLHAWDNDESAITAAVDDLPEEITGYGEVGIPCVVTEGSVGLTDDGAERLIKLLRRV